jgi:hypothetical protein
MRAHTFGSDCNFCGKNARHGMVMEILADCRAVLTMSHYIDAFRIDYRSACLIIY